MTSGPVKLDSDSANLASPQLELATITLATRAPTTEAPETLDPLPPGPNSEALPEDHRALPKALQSWRSDQFAGLKSAAALKLSPPNFAAPASAIEPSGAPSAPSIAQVRPSPGNEPPAAQLNCDPELGCVRLAEPCFPDPELGCIRLKDPQLPAPSVIRGPTVFLQARLDYLLNTNAFSGRDPIQDGLLRPALSLRTLQTLDPDVYFSASADLGLVRYNNQISQDYNDLQLRAGILRRISPTMFAEVGWSNQQLFISTNRLSGFSPGQRFLNDHAVRLDLYRQDRLGPRLNLNSFYEFRASFAQPVARSRIVNTFGLALAYEIQPRLQVGIDYLLVATDFTKTSRIDTYHQLLGRLTYTVLPNTQLNLFGGKSFGQSSDSGINFNNFLFGVSLSTSIPLF